IEQSAGRACVAPWPRRSGAKVGCAPEKCAVCSRQSACVQAKPCTKTTGLMSSCAAALFLFLVFFRQQARPLLDDVFELRFRDQQRVAAKRLLARQPLVDFLQPLLGILALGPG